VFIPGVPLPVLRAAAMRHQVGGVGYYPTSGSPFVHMDTGNVRAWPRMTRAQLKTVFPDGKTLHLPVDGTPLSNDGRQYAMAQWNKCHMVPCSGDGSVPAAVPTGDDVRLAALDPAQRTVPTIAIEAPPVPMMRPGTENIDADTQVADARPAPLGRNDPSSIFPFSKPPALTLATRGETALGAIDDSLAGDAPRPRALITPKEDTVLTAYAPESIPDPGAQEALRLIIERGTTASAILPKKAADVPEVHTASLGGTNGLTAVKNIFDLTWTAVTEAGSGSRIANTLTSSVVDPSPVVGLKQRDVELIAPEIDHVNETLATPLPMTDAHYADMYEPEGYLDNSAELGPLANQIGLEPDTMAPPRYDRFIVRSPTLVASRG
jgi:hypothetical protein